MPIEIQCDDFLEGNDHLYARKARRKKLAFARVALTNRSAGSVQINIRSAKLISGGTPRTVENVSSVFRRLSEFTWDFLIYMIVDFHPLTAIFEGLIFFTGPLFSRRLRRQLSELRDDELTLNPGESKSVLIAFAGVKGSFEKIVVPIRFDDREETVECTLGQARAN